ncbi:MAG: c-type cytochrome [Chloroflexi bacterium]|nr:c-type cytochrome [Chloroflexota bacterium]
MIRKDNVRSCWTLLLVLAPAACGGVPATGAALGEELFQTCAPCHGENGGGNLAISAPGIAGLPDWYIQSQLEKFQAGMRGSHPGDTAGLRMRPMAVTLNGEGQIAAVAEYVAGLAPVDPGRMLAGNAGAGAVRYQLCSACHGANGEGNEILNAPPLVGSSDWYLVAQLRKFKAGMRGADPADTWGATMRPNALTLDEAAMEDVVAYVQTLR